MSQVTAALRRLLLIAATLVVAALALWASPASAHAELLSTDPADGAVLDAAPRTIGLQFSESVAVRADGVRVLDASGRRVDRGLATATGSSVTAPVEGGLRQGSYVVAWRVVSADGHPVRGALTFSIGQASDLGSGLADQAFSSGADRPIEIGSAVLRVLGYLGTLGACGVVLVAARLRRPDEPTPVARWVTAGVVVALVSLALQSVALAALATGEGLGSIAKPGVLSLVVSDGYGPAALLTLVALLCVLITTGLPFEGAARRIAVAGAVVAPVAFALTGHTRTMDPRWAGYLLDGVHLVAGTIWFGGLGACASIVARRRGASDAMGAAEAVASFSGLAAVASGAVVAAGIGLSWIEVGGLHALTSTTYGRLLLAKVAAVAVVLAIAGWNRFRLVPVVARGALDEPEAADTAAWRSLTRTIRAEALLLVAVLALTGVLVNVTPAKASVDRGPITVTADLGDGTVDVTIDPARPGRNDIHAYLYDADGKVEDRYADASFRLELPAQDLGPFDRTPVRAAPGHFQLVGTNLPLAGAWTLTITVKPDRFTETTATVTFEVR